jgi:hypothetical protein
MGEHGHGLVVASREALSERRACGTNDRFGGREGGKNTSRLGPQTVLGIYATDSSTVQVESNERATDRCCPVSLVQVPASGTYGPKKG